MTISPLEMVRLPVLVPVRRTAAEIYGFSANAHKALSGYLKSMFNGFETKGFTYGDPNGTYANNQTRTVKMDTQPVIQSLLALPMRGFCYDIFNNQLNDSISCTMQDTARAMTKVIRDYQCNATSLDQYATIGVTYTMLLTVEVAWLWLVPIGMLWTMCAILTLGTMRKDRREGASGMALNPINLLFANVEDRTDVEDAPASWWRSKDEAQNMAKQMKAQLQMDGKKISFVQKSVSVAG